MALISMRQLLDHAAENDSGAPAFNVNNLEQMRAIMEGVDETGSPVIVQASAGARAQHTPSHAWEFVGPAGTAAGDQRIRASKLKVNTLEVMFAQYASGDLDPVVN